VNVGYSYWGADKYYQQKATRTLGASDSEGGYRYSFTDYYDATAPQGSKGQTSKVYDEKRSQFILDNTVPIPPSSPALDPSHYWRYRIKPAADTYTAKFEYDLKGRPSKVWKIQKTTTNPWTYVRTETLYGADQAPTWGAATQVTEDAGGINRVTQTLAYDNIGRAIKVQDASGKVFETLYDLDGVIQGINQIVGVTTTPVVTYTYGTSGITNGAVLSVTDNLSGISQNITYFAAGSGVAQPATVSESGGPSTPYSVDYTYNAAGERETATFNTQAVFTAGASVKWLYEGYRAVGFGAGRSRVFQRMVRIDPATNARTPEEFHYSYDARGRLREATFAMTPNATSVPTGGATYYTFDKPAATRARAVYDYDSAGHVTKLGYFWDTWSGSSYSSSAIQRNEAAYEMGSGLRRGLKLTSSHFGATGGATRTESYSYDNDLDYLVGANYGDGLPNANVTWGYDAAGNRVSDSAQPGSWTYDNLNRILTSPGMTYDHDILGNRLLKSGGGGGSTTTMTWDQLNRMTGFKAGYNAQHVYAYRADGMRTSKSAATGASSATWTRYRYDGQMGMEDLEGTTVSGVSTITAVTRTGLGARSVEVISKTTSSGNTLTYPLYDIHGNMVAALAKAGSTFSVGEARTYDAWGQVRSQAGTDGKLRYCGNLGHKQDDESGLIYMRARYYEPSSGRFVSEDPAMHGLNWMVYCGNQPISRSDLDGKKFDSDGETLANMIMGNVLLAVGMMLVHIGTSLASTSRRFDESVRCVLLGLSAMLLSEVCIEWGPVTKWAAYAMAGILGRNYAAVVQILANVQAGSTAKPEAAGALQKVANYTFMVLAALLAIEFWEANIPERK
jgi:RHS repeat-associated protein